MGQLEQTSIQRVAPNINTYGENYLRAFSEQIIQTKQGKASDHEKHNAFYDEYLAIMDMMAEFYLSTVDRLFIKCEIAKNTFTL